MMFEVIYTLALFLLALSLLPLMVFVCRRHERSKRAVVEGMAQLSDETRHKLGWLPARYISTWDLGSPFRLGWKTWSLQAQKQNEALQRVWFRGLPDTVEISKQTTTAARAYRWYSLLGCLVLGLLVFLPATVRMARWMEQLTTVVSSVWLMLFGTMFMAIISRPLEKFHKWPDIEEIS